MSDKTAKVIIISGQSNAVGYSYRNFLPENYAGEYPAEKLEKADAGFPNILIKYRNNPLDANQGTCSNGTFEPVRTGMGSIIPDPYYYKDGWGVPIGPEIGIAEHLTEVYPDEKFYIVKCATSGANLSRRWNPARDDDLYSDMVSFVGEAFDELSAQGLRPLVVSFCWMQGESDCQENSTSYFSTFNMLVEKFSETFSGYIPESGMPVADAGILPFSGWPEWASFNEKKKANAEEHPNFSFVDTSDLDFGKDRGHNGHFDSYGMIVLGRRFGMCVEKALDGISDRA